MVRHMLALAMGGALLVAGCGDDDDEASDEFCDVARELADAGDVRPSDELLDRYVEVAPDEIADEAEVATEAIKERGEAAFEDPDVLDAIEDIEAFEAERCGIGRDGDNDGDVDGDVDDTDGAPTDDGTTDDTVDEGTTGGDGTTSTVLEDEPTSTVTSTP